MSQMLQGSCVSGKLFYSFYYTGTSHWSLLSTQKPFLPHQSQHWSIRDLLVFLFLHSIGAANTEPPRLPGMPGLMSTRMCHTEDKALRNRICAAGSLWPCGQKGSQGLPPQLCEHWAAPPLGAHFTRTHLSKRKQEGAAFWIASDTYSQIPCHKSSSQVKER